MRYFTDFEYICEHIETEIKWLATLIQLEHSERHIMEQAGKILGLIDMAYTVNIIDCEKAKYYRHRMHDIYSLWD